MENNSSKSNEIKGAVVDTAGKATQATGAAIEAGGRATEATGAAVQVGGKATEVAGVGMQAAGKGLDAAGKGLDAGGNALIEAGTSLSGTGYGAIAGVPMMVLGGLASGAGKVSQVGGKGLDAAGKGTQNAGKAMNKTGEGIRRTGHNIAEQGKNVKNEGKQISDAGKQIKSAPKGLGLPGLGGNAKGGIDGIVKGGFIQKFKWYLIAGGAGCGLGGLVLICILGVVFSVVSSVAESLSPITDFFASLGHWFAGDGWCPNEVECARKAESDFYTKVEDLYNAYLNVDGVELDTEVLTAAALYNRFDNFNAVAIDSSAIVDEDETVKTDEQKLEAYKDGIDRVERLAKNMVSHKELDYSKFKRYLVNEYLPANYSSLYESQPEEEHTYIKTFHANAIISFSRNADAYDALAVNPMGRFCSAVLINDETGKQIASMKLEDYVNAVVEANAASFSVETQKSLAIAVRTYVIESTDYCEYALTKGSTALTYSDTVSDTVKENISDVKNLVMYYNEATFIASYDNFTGECDSTTGKCMSTTYTKIPTEDIHSFEVDTSKVKIPSDKISKEPTSKGLSLYGAENMSVSGIKYEEILHTFYADDIEIRAILAFDSDYLGTEGIYKDMLWPVGWPNETGSCISAGKCYGGRTECSNPKDDYYHYSQDIACYAMYGTDVNCWEVPIISSYPGVITSIIKNSWCTRRTDNGDKRLPYDANCAGNGMRIKVTDSSSDAYGYTIVYWHFDSIPADLVVGSEVQAGQFLGYMGSTGNSTGFHLHYQVLDTNGAPVVMDDQYKSYCTSHIASN